MLSQDAADRAGLLAGVPVVGHRPIAGGDLSAVIAIDFEGGRSAIVKSGPSPAAEARMLEAFRATGVRVPAVLGFDDSVLVLERLPSNGRIDHAWPDLGEQLQLLHDGSSVHGTRSRYGWDEDYAFGKVTIINSRTDDWPEFWAAHRLTNQAEFVGPELASRLERLAKKLPELVPGQPSPSLLHGDLWGGNVLVDGDSVSGLIDPACYFGDREVDFAMLHLFNHPDASLFDACDKLADGHLERRPVYQLWPALVHLRLFGSGYLSMVDRMLRQIGF